MRVTFQGLLIQELSPIKVAVRESIVSINLQLNRLLPGLQSFNILFEFIYLLIREDSLVGAGLLKVFDSLVKLGGPGIAGCTLHVHPS